MAQRWPDACTHQKTSPRTSSFEFSASATAAFSSAPVTSRRWPHALASITRMHRSPTAHASNATPQCTDPCCGCTDCKRTPHRSPSMAARRFPAPRLLRSATCAPPCATKMPPSRRTHPSRNVPADFKLRVQCVAHRRVLLDLRSLHLAITRMHRSHKSARVECDAAMHRSILRMH